MTILLLIFISLCVYAQNDSLVFKNGNIIVGEIKSMDRGVVVVSTDYSDSDFKIEWDKIITIRTVSIFFIRFLNSNSYALYYF